MDSQEEQKSPLAENELAVAISSPMSSDNASILGNGRQVINRCGICHVGHGDTLLPCSHTLCTTCLINSEWDKMACPQCMLENGLSPQEIANFSAGGLTECDETKVFCPSYNDSGSVVEHYGQNSGSNSGGTHGARGHWLHGQNFLEETKWSDAVLPTGALECLSLNESEPNEQTCGNLNEADVLNLGTQDTKNKVSHINKIVEQHLRKLEVHYHKAQDKINLTLDFHKSILEQRAQEVRKDLEYAYFAKYAQLEEYKQKAQSIADKVYQLGEVSDMVNYDNLTEECLTNQEIISDLLKLLTKDESVNKLEFISNYKTIKFGVLNTFGYLQINIDNTFNNCRPSPMGQFRETNEPLLPSANHCKNQPVIPSIPGNSVPESSDLSTSLALEYNKVNPQMSLLSDLDLQNASLIKLGIRRQTFSYHRRWGNFGKLDGEFSEPNGVAVNAYNEIIVTDTNNHRVQVFTGSGKFKFEFGKFDGEDQLVYPHRVAVHKLTGDIIVTERSPVHQIKIYNQYGQFVRKFGKEILKFPRAIAIDFDGRIIVVECKIMRVIIFDISGQILRAFDCSQHLAFPNSVTVNNKKEIFISDNTAHSIKVFSYDGVLLRQIGGLGITNYPVGVAIDPLGQVMVADNHNNFNVTLFTPEGQLVSAYESAARHAQILDVALTKEGTVVVAGKDYRLFLYNL